jgi:hypothetical protein
MNMVVCRALFLVGVAWLVGCLAPQAEAVSATGGTVTNYVENGTNFTTYIFTNNDTFLVAEGGDVEYLVVGGGSDTGQGLGGDGGGGKGGNGTTHAVPIAGTANLGGGGGGGGSQAESLSGANGGSGIVIVRYLLPSSGTVITTR